MPRVAHARQWHQVTVVSREALFNGHVMVGSALRALVRDTGLFDLARGQLVQRFTGLHVEFNNIMPATADFTITTPAR